jgi:iron(II)-dependent oxidoreductase
MSLTKKSFRHATANELALMLSEAHNYTLSLFKCFASEIDNPGDQTLSQHMNSQRWELGHLGWFAEWLILREASPQAPHFATRPSMLSKGDAWFDPQQAQCDQLQLTLPKATQLITYKNEVLDRVLDKLQTVAGNDAALYPYRMALAHEDWHAEHWIAKLQALGLPAPLTINRHTSPPWAQGEIRYPGGNLLMGSEYGNGFVFDTETSTHTIYVPAFSMDSTLISNAQFSEFIEDNGYQRAQYWSQAGVRWLMQQERSAPLHWSREGNWWRTSRFGREISLSPSEAVRHLSLYEAQAYCVWAERRLPSEAEWDFAANFAHASFHWGSLWEWTCSPFVAYPGFRSDNIGYGAAPDAAFDSHQSVRGASFATAARMHSTRYRNFLLPEHCADFSGFRTCRL